MFINWKTRELNLNIVYYGPARCGKTTNLMQIHQHLNAASRSELFTLNTHEDRTIFFDFLQLEIGAVGGLKPKFGLYTVPGQVYYEATREAVLRRADSVVFVVDSQAERLEDNRVSWGDLQRHLERMGQRLPDFPAIIQFNKRDMPTALPVDRLKQALGVGAYPSYEAIASQGAGVRETMQAMIKGTLAHVQRKLAVQAKAGK